MHVLTWILTGLLAGWLARRAQGARGPSYGTDLTLGLLGALVGGFLLRRLGLTASGAGWAHVLVALIGAFIVMGGGRLALHLTATAARLAGARRATSTIEALESRIARLVGTEGVLPPGPASRDPNKTFDDQLTLGQRMSDNLAAFGGSWGFLGFFFVVLLGWMIYNTEYSGPFDPYPFILLNLVLSCLAAVQAPIILMSQNRQAARDRLDARLDYEVNLKAEMEILMLHEKLDALRQSEWRELVALQERQLALLEQLARASADRG